MVGRSDVEDQEPRCLPRVTKAAGDGQERLADSPRQRQGACEAQQQEERRRKRRSKRRRQRVSAQGGRELPRPKSGLNATAGHFGPKVPGAGASTVHGKGIWNSLFDFLTSSRSKLSKIWRTQRAGRASAKAPEGVVWPMPLPFPELHLPGGNRSQCDLERKLGLNYVVLVLNSLRFQKRRPSQVMPGIGSKLNKAQWSVVQRLAAHVDVWNSEGPVGPAEMGRSAAKMESVEEVLSNLLQFASSQRVGLHAYGRKFRGPTARTEAAESERDEGEPNFSAVPSFEAETPRRRPQSTEAETPEKGKASDARLGSLTHLQAPVAKKVEPDRFQFWLRPSFDPSKFLDDHNRETFLYPLDWADEPDVEAHPVPRVRVFADDKEKGKLLEVLDSGKRLGLLPVTAVRMPFRNGMFSIPKDAERDRMVLDARPPNALEDGKDSDWIQSLGSISQFLHWFLEEDEVARVFSEDIREFYHAFVISARRLQRNALAMEVEPYKVKHLSCFRPWMWKHKRLVPCLNTMAMGDCRAVTYGQVSHLSCLLRVPELSLDSFISLKGRPSRGDFVAGLMIDDFIMVEKSRRDEPQEKLKLSRCSQIAAEVRKQYEEVGLPRHPGKAVENALCASFWGVDFDGEAGTIRPNLRRCIPVAFIVLEMLKLGCTSVSLLEVISGSLVSIFQCRRRFMSCLQYVYEMQRGRRQSDVLRISEELCDELLQCIALLPLACLDMRLKPSSKLIASDASPWATAAVLTELTAEATAEFQRHTLQKGLWNRLLSPVGAYLREKGLLEAESELPNQQAYDMHPLWEEIVLSSEFQQFGKTKRRKGRQHINLGEVAAALDAEEKQGAEEPSSFYVHLQDSQVSLACLIKGRSSSTAVNQMLRESIPSHVVNNNCAFYGYVRSKKNPADAPTRSRPVPQPVKERESWLEEALKGQFAAFDEFLESVGMDLKTVRGLPDAEELLQPCDVDVSSSSVRRKERRKTLRKEGSRVLQAQESDMSSPDLHALPTCASSSQLPAPSVTAPDSVETCPAVSSFPVQKESAQRSESCYFLLAENSLSFRIVLQV